MKKIKFLAVALAALTMASCSKEKMDNDHELSGEQVYAQFNIQFPTGVGSKAVDTNGTTIDNTISDIQVYILSNNMVEAIASIDAPTDNENYKTAAIKITTGDKQVIAIANGNGRPTATFKVGSTLTDIQTAILATEGDAASKTNVLFTSRPKDEKIAKQTDNATQQIKITVERAVAKIVVRDGITANQNLGVDYKATSGEFTINGKSTNASVIQSGTEDAPVNSTKMVVDWKETAFIDYELLSTNDKVLKEIQGKLVLENVVPSTEVSKKATVIYAKIKLIPKVMTSGTLNTEGDYFALEKKAGGTPLFFENKEACNTWIAENTETAAQYKGTGSLYTGGINYYAVKITHDIANALTKYSVIRNNIYDVTLKEIKALGKNTDVNLVDPTDPLETEVFIEAEVNIVPWTVKAQDANLE